MLFILALYFGHQNFTTQDFVRLKNKFKKVVELFMVVLLEYETQFISIPKCMILSIIVA